MKKSVILVLIWLASTIRLHHVDGLNAFDKVMLPFSKWYTVAKAVKYRNAKLSTILAQSGPVFIKLGQWLSCRPDLLSHDTIQDLRCLTDTAPAHSFSYTEKVLKGYPEFGYGKDLKILCKDPLGSGSLAQVYKAEYKGKECVIKILHPDIKKRVARDIALIKSLMKIGALNKTVRKFKKTFDLETFFNSIIDQLDMRLEASRMTKMGACFESIDRVHVPSPIAIKPLVLIESYAQGVALDEFLKRHPAGSIEANFLTCWTLRKMILQDNWIHADLHQGNLLYRYQDGSVHLDIIDFGLVVSLDPDTASLSKEFLRFLFLPCCNKEAELLASFNMKKRDKELQGRIMKIIQSYIENNVDNIYDTLILQGWDLRKLYQASIDELLEMAEIHGPIKESTGSFGNLFERLSAEGAMIDLFKASTFIMLDGLECTAMAHLSTTIQHLIYYQKALQYGVDAGFYNMERLMFSKKKGVEKLSWVD